jgi:hypothetical protein
MKTWKKDIFDHLSHPKRHLSSLSKRRMEDFNQDYWYSNDWTIENAYPLPLISEIMDKLKGTKYFSKFDV